MIQSWKSKILKNSLSNEQEKVSFVRLVSCKLAIIRVIRGLHLLNSGPRREFLYVDDVADAVVFLMRNYHAKDIDEFVNIGTGKDLTIRCVGHNDWQS